MMPREYDDLSNKKFGRLTPVERVSVCNRSYWKCKCDCGNEKTIRASHLKSGDTKSCGCLNIENASVLWKTYSTRTHGYSNKERLYRIWKSLKSRCYNKSVHNYYRYGGRGITVCDSWKNDYMSFRNWALSNGYRDDLTIDRIDNDGNYYPENCRWSTKKEQSNNRSTNCLITAFGETKNISEWSDITGINKSTIQARYSKYGKTPEQTLMRGDYRGREHRNCKEN